jgi:hypothetical protein
MTDQPRISAKNLGLLMLPYFCACCFWLELKFWNKKVPFRFPPARLINSLDRFQKKMVESYFVENAAFPKWLGKFAEAVDYYEVKKLRIEDEDTGLIVTGIPDLIVDFMDNKYGVVDFKTAPYQDGQDKLKPMYHVQVNAYAYLLNISEGMSVSKGGFAYFEADTGQLGCEPHELVTEDGHTLPFKVTVEEIELKPAAIVHKLLNQVKKIYDLDEPPASKEGCPNCVRLAEYVELITGKKVRLQDTLSRKIQEPGTNSCGTPGVMELWDSSES